MLEFLNVFFIVFHTGFTLFNLFGWIWKKTRLANLITLSLTAFSWSVLGIWYGFGYCPCTDWHWQVRWELGLRDMPHSYLTFLIRELTGLQLNPQLVDITALVIFGAVFILSIVLNIRDYRKRKEN